MSVTDPPTGPSSIYTSSSIKKEYFSGLGMKDILHLPLSFKLFPAVSDCVPNIGYLWKQQVLVNEVCMNMNRSH